MGTRATANRCRAVVFLGPSLPLEDARSILPDAIFLPPVQCRDVLRSLRLAPRVIVIIDGLFERVAAVWHKEILVALSRGVEVVGGGSMGALRAAELAEFGMIGIGKSFTEYHDGTLLDDDEVAVVHTAGGEVLTDAMVNIRDTIRHAVDRGILDPADAARIESSSKRLFYAERTLERGARESSAAGVSRQTVEAFLAWSRSGGYRDRKRADAIEVLRFAASLEPLDPPVSAPEIAPMTGLLRTLACGVACAPFSEFHPDLPVDETVALAARFLGTAYEETRRLAAVLAAVHDLAEARGVSPASDDEVDPEFVLGGEMLGDSFSRRMRLVQGFENDLRARSLRSGTVPSVDSYVRWLMIVDGTWAANAARSRGGAVRSPRQWQYRRLRLTARLWRLFDLSLVEMETEPRRDLLQEFADEFRRDRGLEQTDAMRLWLDHNRLDPDELIVLLKAWYKFDKLVESQSLSVLGVRPRDNPVWWLLDAMRLGGTYEPACALLSASAGSLVQAVDLPRSEVQAFRRDFLTGLSSVTSELARLEEIASNSANGSPTAARVA